ncbi:MAG: ParA family protein [Candidatus Omnitrophica bacterium]|nr:ParA family protein [Candidatus Omnitrophota bacterium]
MFEDLGSVLRNLYSDNPQKQTGHTARISGPEASAPPSKTIIIAIVNQKGGCGKTTTCINLAAGLAKRGFKVLMIDLDPQSHASLGVNIDVHNLGVSIYDVLVKSTDLNSVIVPTYLNGLDLAPATSLLTGAQLEIADLLGREGLLRTSIWRMLNTHVRHYDYILMDSSPSLNLLTINGLTAAQSVLIPIQAHYFSLEGGRTKMSRDMLAQLKDYFKEKVLQSLIRMNITLAEASAHGKSIFDFDAASNGAKDYRQLTEEILLLTRPELAAAAAAATVTAPERESNSAVS